MPAEPIHIAFCTDTNYAMPCGVAMISVCEHHRDEALVFHLVITDEGETPEAMAAKVQPLLDIASRYHQQAVVYHIAQDALSSYECRGSQYISVTAFSRIFLPQLLPTDIHRVIYLDGDIAVCGSLRGLWDIALDDDCPMGAMIDMHGNVPQVRQCVQLPMEIPYVNSGVLLMNLDCWRREGLTEQVARNASQHQFPFLDQDALNYTLRGRIKILPVRYNFQTFALLEKPFLWQINWEYLSEVEEAAKAPVVIHYISANKPWTNAWCPLREVWERYRQLSPWRDVPLQPVRVAFERSHLYTPFVEAYWSDSDLMLQSLQPFLNCFRQAVRLKNKRFIMRVATLPLVWMAKVLGWVNQFKQR